MTRARSSLTALITLVLWSGVTQGAAAALVEVRASPPSGPPQDYSFTIQEGETFAISFVHSVERSVVYEIFGFEPGVGLVLLSTRYQALGAGLPYHQGDWEFRWEDGWYTLDGIQRPIGVLQLIISPLNVYTIHHPRGEISFHDSPLGTRLHIQALATRGD